MLIQDGSRTRQRRFRQRLDALRLDAAALTDHRDVYYLTGRLFPDRLPIFLLLETEGDSWLVAPREMEGGCVAECLTYEWNELGTNHFDPLRRTNAVVAQPARDRAIERGELYIIDAWTCCCGYWSDLSRVFLVGDRPTDLQQSLFDHIASVQRHAGKLLRPGLDTRELWRAMDQMIREHPALADSGLIHHGGHAIGLRIHEEPDVNR